MVDDLDKFTIGYIACALWSSTDGNQEPLDNNYNIEDIAPNTLQGMVEDCADFQAKNAELLAAISGYGHREQAGHDFWLTRNRHGAGFWDRGLDAIGELLTKSSHAYGTVDLYVGDDGKIYS